MRFRSAPFSLLGLQKIENLFKDIPNMFHVNEIYTEVPQKL